MKKTQEQKEIEKTSKKIQKMLNNCHKKINGLLNDKGIYVDLKVDYKTFEANQQSTQE